MLANRNDLMGVTVTVVSGLFKPYSFYEESESGLVLKGLAPDLMKVVAEKLNFTLNLDPKPRTSWGTKQTNGSWSGIVGKCKDCSSI